MGFFKNPVGEGKSDPYEGYKVEPILEKQTKQPSPFPDKEDKDKKKFRFLSYLLFFFSKIFDSFLKKERKENASQKGLLKIKLHFEILKKEDRSQDAEFLKNLSEAWIAFLEVSKKEEKAKLFIKKIQDYPKQASHSFGYYLTEFSGKKWIPFPYMELIYKLHKEHEKAAESSHLSEWVRFIDELS